MIHTLSVGLFHWPNSFALLRPHCLYWISHDADWCWFLGGKKLNNGCRDISNCLFWVVEQLPPDHVFSWIQDWSFEPQDKDGTFCVCVCVCVCVVLTMSANVLLIFCRQMAQSKQIYKLIFFWLQGKQTGFICSCFDFVATRHTHTHTHTHTQCWTHSRSVCLWFYLS